MGTTWSHYGEISGSKPSQWESSTSWDKDSSERKTFTSKGVEEEREEDYLYQECAATDTSNSTVMNGHGRGRRDISDASSSQKAFPQHCALEDTGRSEEDGKAFHVIGLVPKEISPQQTIQRQGSPVVRRRIPEAYKDACLRRWDDLLPRLSSPVTGELRHDDRAVSQAYYFDWRGHSPLHKAAFHGAPLQVINSLALTYPPALTRCSKEGGWTPLSLACWREAHSDVILHLIRYAPSAARLVTHSGKTPLYCCCMWVRKCRYQVLEALVAEYPEAVLLEDEEGHTPLHLVALEFRLLMYRTLAKVQKCSVSGGRDELEVADVAARMLRKSRELRDAWKKLSLLIQVAHMVVKQKTLGAEQPPASRKTSSYEPIFRRQLRLFLDEKRSHHDCPIGLDHIDPEAMQVGILQALSSVAIHICKSKTRERRSSMPSPRILGLHSEGQDPVSMTFQDNTVEGGPDQSLCPCFDRSGALRSRFGSCGGEGVVVLPPAMRRPSLSKHPPQPALTDGLYLGLENGVSHGQHNCTSGPQQLVEPMIHGETDVLQVFFRFARMLHPDLHHTAEQPSLRPLSHHHNQPLGRPRGTGLDSPLLHNNQVAIAALLPATPDQNMAATTSHHLPLFAPTTSTLTFLPPPLNTTPKGTKMPSLRKSNPDKLSPVMAAGRKTRSLSPTALKPNMPSVGKGSPRLGLSTHRKTKRHESTLDNSRQLTTYCPIRTSPDAPMGESSRTNARSKLKLGQPIGRANAA